MHWLASRSNDGLLAFARAQHLSMEWPVYIKCLEFRNRRSEALYPVGRPAHARHARSRGERAEASDGRARQGSTPTASEPTPCCGDCPPIET